MKVKALSLPSVDNVIRVGPEFWHPFLLNHRHVPEPHIHVSTVTHSAFQTNFEKQLKLSYLRIKLTKLNSKYLAIS